MNRFDGGMREAKIRYLDGDYQVLMSGSHVICAVTGKQVPVDELRYWSVARQEASIDAAASLEAERRAGGIPERAQGLD